MQAVLDTVILQSVFFAVPAALVQTRAPEADTAAWIPRVAVPELPEAQVRLIVCVGADGCILKLTGLMVGVPREPVPVTVTAALMICVLMMLAAGHGDVATEQASTVTGSAQSVAA